MPKQTLILISPARAVITPEQELQRAKIQDLVAAQDLEVVHLRALSYKSVRETSRTVLVLDPWSALDLYEQIHLGYCLVVVIGRVRVMRRYKIGPSTSNSVPISKFVQHKAIVFSPSIISTEAQVHSEIEQFYEWASSMHCSGERDHRVLPMHSFSPDEDWADLGTLQGIRRFERTHGTAGSLQDASSRPWKRADAHGSLQTWVAGREITPGTHWDVQSTSATTTFYAIHQIWRIPKYGYLNVYPNGHVRGAKSNAVSMIDQADKPAWPVTTNPSKKVRKGRRKARNPHRG